MLQPDIDVLSNNGLSTDGAPTHRLCGCQLNVLYARPQPSDGVPPRVSWRVLDILTYLAKHQSLVASLLLYFDKKLEGNQKYRGRGMRKEPGEAVAAPTNGDTASAPAEAGGDSDVQVRATENLDLEASTSSSESNIDPSKILMSLPSEELCQLSLLLAREGLSELAYTRVTEVLNKIAELAWLWPASLVLTAAGSAPLLLCQDDAQFGEIMNEGRAESLPSSFVEELRRICGADGVSVDEDERSFHSKSVSNFHPVIKIPDVVVYPRYGTMKDNVLAIRAVLADGTVVKTANRARKSAAGYDLTRLLIGSEGTLGVLIEVTLCLQKIPESSAVAICSFESVKDAADVAIAIMHSGIQASRLELLDEVMMKALNKANDKTFPEKPTLMFEFIGTDAYAKEQSMQVQKIANEHKGNAYTLFELLEEKERLWTMRKEILWACLAMQEKTGAISTDVCVPLSRLAECISRTTNETDSSFLMCASLAHAGDGNCHTLILFDSSSNEDVQEAKRLSTFIVNLALEMEGTCNGEHGVGVAKSKYLEKELGAESLKAMQTIKQALDPGNIMNPGKVIPSKFCS
ncbi:hypothetical protein GOP47_0005155 [Adiantum capillus-veneris]|uniref:D-lactate dehydrogenase (cytochrome) n=1 Tax=Adiantum capillus-veneris TaxID=13818 RepID=A0A9D4ZNC2_ADICA|nr:hypothetical protein GOP47_0005155 [Adiantum capillus-veneris]